MLTAARCSRRSAALPVTICAVHHAGGDVRRPQHGEHAAAGRRPSRAPRTSSTSWPSCSSSAAASRAPRSHSGSSSPSTGMSKVEADRAACRGRGGQLGERRLRRRGPGRVAELGAGHQVEQRRGVGGGAGQHAVGREEVVAEVGRPRDAPARGLRPTSPQQAAGIRIEPPPSLAWATGTAPAGHGAAGPAARAAGRALRVPRVARRAEAARLGHGQDPELGRLGLADEHEARLPEAAHRARSRSPA